MSRVDRTRIQSSLVEAQRISRRKEHWVRYYSDFRLTGGVLGPPWANRPDFPEVTELDDRDHPLETLDIGTWLHLPEATREAVVAEYLGGNRLLERKTIAKRS
jgi:hypothetical protein